jgi:hypothetical protein
VKKFVVSYFTLAEGDTIEAYSEWSMSYVRPVMRAMPSVLSFLDFRVVGAMEGATPEHDGCEIIEVTDFAAFEADNADGEGGVLASKWRERLEAWSIGYLTDLEAVGARE